MTGTLTDAPHGALLYSMAEWKEATFFDTQTDGCVCVSWDQDWMHVFPRGCGVRNNLEMLLTGNTSWTVHRYEVDGLTPGGSSEPSSAACRVMMVVSAVHTDCAHSWSKLLNRVHIFFSHFHIFIYIYFNFWIAQSRTYTKGDAMMFSHNAHQNTAPEIRAVY